MKDYFLLELSDKYLVHYHGLINREHPYQQELCAIQLALTKNQIRIFLFLFKQLLADQGLRRKLQQLIVLDKFSQGFPYPPIFKEVPREFVSSHRHHLQLNHRNCNLPYDRYILMLKFQPLEFHEISPYLSWQ